MGYINQKNRKTFRDEAHLNWMGGPSYNLSNPLGTLRMAASSCFFGEPMYYHRDKNDKRPKRKATISRYGAPLSASDVNRLRETLDAQDPQEWRGMTPAKLMESAIDKALDYDPEATLRFAAELRNDLYIRTTPQVILVRAAHHPKLRGTGLVRRYGRDILARADEPAVAMAYQIATYGRKAIPNALKKALRDRLERSTEYELAKYRMDGHFVTTREVAHLVHPKGEVGSPIHKLRAGELKLTGSTWESYISENGSNKDTWTKAVDKMGHMALLRNLRNLLQNGVDPALFVDKLCSGAVTGKQLPFRYYSAYKAVESAHGSPVVLDAIENCMEASMGNLPRFNGKVMSLCDNSGSAQGNFTSAMGSVRMADIANLTGIITGKIADEGYLGLFGDELEVLPVRKRSSVFDQLKVANDTVRRKIGGGTENGIWLFWDEAIRKKQHWDHVFVYSDMQAGHGGLYGTNARAYKDYIWGNRGGHFIDVPKLIATYRTKVNPNVQVYLVQVAGYQDTILPEFYNRTYILGGWSDQVLRFAHAMSTLENQKSPKQ